MTGLLDAVEQYASAAASVARLHGRGCSNAAIKSAIRTRQSKRTAMREAIDTLRAQLEAAEAGNHRRSDSQPTWAELTQYWKARAEAAEAECARLRADAERYRFIRSASTPNVPELNVLALGALDRAIDAAIARTKEETK